MDKLETIKELIAGDGVDLTDDSQLWAAMSALRWSGHEDLFDALHSLRPATFWDRWYSSAA